MLSLLLCVLHTLPALLVYLTKPILKVSHSRHDNVHAYVGLNAWPGSLIHRLPNLSLLIGGGRGAGAHAHSMSSHMTTSFREPAPPSPMKGLACETPPRLHDHYLRLPSFRGLLPASPQFYENKSLPSRILIIKIVFVTSSFFNKLVS